MHEMTMARTTTTIAHRKHHHHHHHHRRRNSRLWENRCCLWLCGASLVFLYLVVLVIHHRAVALWVTLPLPLGDITDNGKDALLSPPGMELSRNSHVAFSSATRHTTKSTKTAGKPKGKATLNTIPLQWRNEGPPPVAQVHCLGLDNHNSNSNDSNNNNNTSLSWMFRSCEYRNLCIDLQTHEYVVFVDNDDDNTDSSNHHHHHSPFTVALGPINPRWNVGNGLDRGWHKVQWQPSTIQRSSSNVTFYYQLPETTTLLPFHSMAGHNIGHLAWDDLWAVYKLWHQFSTPTTTPLVVDQQQQQRGGVDDDSTTNTPSSWLLLLLRHQINEPLYANCDIRRNKRLQCRANFERFVPLLGIDSQTFSTTKQLQLQLHDGDDDHSNNNNVNNNNVTSSIVCARRGLAGLGLLQDHGFRDHGWDAPPPVSTTSTAEILTVPHNLGAGRTFYDYAQLLRQQAALLNRTSATTTTTTTTTTTGNNALRVPHSGPPVISFSLRSSRDWMRRQNFTAQIDALQQQQSNNHVDAAWQIQALDLHDMTLTEQVQVAGGTSIFVTTCGGGAVTATFLPRGATLMVFYDAHGGLDFEALSSNQQPARLDWDLLNYAAGAHLRVHWLPLHSMNESNDLQLFVRLVQHEVTILKQQWRDDDDDN